MVAVTAGEGVVEWVEDEEGGILSVVRKVDVAEDGCRGGGAYDRAEVGWMTDADAFTKGFSAAKASSAGSMHTTCHHIDNYRYLQEH